MAPPMARPPEVSTLQSAYSKAAEVECGCDHREPVSYQVQLEKDLATTYYWSGNFCKDYFFFVANWHPLFGMFCSHPCHPWSKCERVGTFIVSCALTLPPSALLVKDMEAVGVQKSMRGPTIFLFVTLPVMLLETALYWVAIADIYCKENPWCCFFRGLLRIVKTFCFTFSLAFSVMVIFFSLNVMLMDEPGQAAKLIRPFVISRIQSMVIWFPLWFLLPCMGFLHCWWMERNATILVDDDGTELD